MKCQWKSIGNQVEISINTNGIKDLNYTHDVELRMKMTRTSEKDRALWI